MEAFLWRDPSPIDGCDLVELTVVAESVDAAAQAAKNVPWSRCRTVSKLRLIGRVRVAEPQDDLPDNLEPGVVHWLSDEGWRPVP